MENAFTMDNTSGYTQAELDAFNAELAERLAEAGFDAGSDDEWQLIKAFQNEVAGR